MAIKTKPVPVGTIVKVLRPVSNEIEWYQITYVNSEETSCYVGTKLDSEGTEIKAHGNNITDYFFHDEIAEICNLKEV